jgi:hypothetical protein
MFSHLGRTLSEASKSLHTGEDMTGCRKIFHLFYTPPATINIHVSTLAHILHTFYVCYRRAVDEPCGASEEDLHCKKWKLLSLMYW